MSSSCASGSSRISSAAEVTRLPCRLPGCAARLRRAGGQAGGCGPSEAWVRPGAAACGGTLSARLRQLGLLPAGGPEGRRFAGSQPDPTPHRRATILSDQ